jgi:Na+/proline symporter
VADFLNNFQATRCRVEGVYVSERIHSWGHCILPGYLYIYIGAFESDTYCDTVPWMFATAAGLAMISLSADVSSPFQAISLAQAGVVAPAAATALLGKSGAILLLIVLFLAVTSAVRLATVDTFITDYKSLQASAELVAVSSIITYDIYKRYFNPHATEKQILRVSHLGVVGFGIFMGILGVIFYEIGISLSWLCESKR